MPQLRHLRYRCEALIAAAIATMRQGERSDLINLTSKDARLRIGLLNTGERWADLPNAGRVMIPPGSKTSTASTRRPGPKPHARGREKQNSQN